MNTGILYSVATPIGNLEDMTPRAVRVLGEVSVVACEDTREVAKLLDAYNVRAERLVAYHAQSNDRVEEELMVLLREGKNVALVSDRGTPAISDPGGRILRRAAEEGIRIEPLPGASAFLVALQGAGVDTNRFEYLGFMPHKKGRQTLFAYIESCDHTIVFYESPHRIEKTLSSLSEGTKKIVVARELTKQHEEFVRGTAAEVLASLQEREAVRGEFVVIVESSRQ